MRRLDRYVMREMFLPFIAGTLIVALLFQANSYIFLAKTYNLDNVPISARILWLLYTLPSQLKLTYPTGMALAASLAVGRMGRESEITAIRAAGAPVFRLMIPVALFGLLAGGLNYWTVSYLIPTYNKKAVELQTKNAILGLSQSTMKENAFIQLERYSASLGRIERLPKDVLSISDVLLIERSGGNVVNVFTAKKGTYDAGVWNFPNGLIYAVKDVDILSMKAKSIVLDQSVDLASLFSASNSISGDGGEEMTEKQLRAAIASQKAIKASPRRYEVELSSRMAAAVACMIFAFTSAVFAVLFSRSGGFAGLLVSFVVVVLYYNAYVISVDILGKQESVPAWVAAWLPNLLFGFVALLGVRRLE